MKKAALVGSAATPEAFLPLLESLTVACGTILLGSITHSERRMSSLHRRAQMFVSIFATVIVVLAEPAEAGGVCPQPTLAEWYHAADTFLFVRRLESGEVEVLDVAKALPDTAPRKGSRIRATQL